MDNAVSSTKEPVQTKFWNAFVRISFSLNKIKFVWHFPSICVFRVDWLLLFFSVIYLKLCLYFFLTRWGLLFHSFLWSVICRVISEDRKRSVFSIEELWKAWYYVAAKKFCFDTVYILPPSIYMELQKTILLKLKIKYWSILVHVPYARPCLSQLRWSSLQG